MLLELLWVEDFGKKAERLNTRKMLLNCSEVLLHCSIEIIIWCPLIVLLEGSQESTLPSICTFILCRTATIHPEGVIYRGKQNPRKRLFSEERGSAMSHDRRGYLDFSGKANNILHWEADVVLPFNASLGSPLHR